MTNKKIGDYTDDFTDADEIKSAPLNLWKYKEQREIMGIISEIGDGQFGTQITLDVGNEDFIVLPSLTALNSRLAEAKTGQKVKIVYVGDTKSQKTGRMYADFKVFLK